jgi:glycerol-1-phosphate dehydrogenase [NAD(P)+]
MIRTTQISIPTLVRIKKFALDRLGVYAQRSGFNRILLIMSPGLGDFITGKVHAAFAANSIEILAEHEIASSSLELAQEIFQTLPAGLTAIFGLGEGKALDVAKYISFLARIPYVAVPTALSNDGFCSPQSSLVVKGKRRSLPAVVPYGVVIDTDVCLHAPHVLWWSGIGDLASKITAVYDWKLAFKKPGTQVDDFAALLSDATVFQLLSQPEKNHESIRLLGTALMLNGIAMEICGSSRPASGSEHLLSHALDLTAPKPRPHGLQVGVATYIMSLLQGQGTDRIVELFDATDFWSAFADAPLLRSEWIRAFEIAPTVKQDFYTILSERDFTEEFARLLTEDERLQRIFR